MTIRNRGEHVGRLRKARGRGNQGDWAPRRTHAKYSSGYRKKQPPWYGKTRLHKRDTVPTGPHPDQMVDTFAKKQRRQKLENKNRVRSAHVKRVHRDNAAIKRERRRMRETRAAA